MAELKVDIKIDGEEKLKQLETQIDRLSQKTVEFDKAILTAGTAIAGLG